MNRARFTFIALLAVCALVPGALLLDATRSPDANLASMDPASSSAEGAGRAPEAQLAVTAVSAVTPQAPPLGPALARGIIVIFRGGDSKDLESSLSTTRSNRIRLPYPPTDLPLLV